MKSRLGIASAMLLLSTTMVGVATGRPDTDSGLGDWYEVRGTVLYFGNGSTSTYEAVVGPNGTYRATGVHDGGTYSETVFFDGRVQTVVFRDPGGVEVQTFVNPTDHFVVAALKNHLNDGPPVDIGTDKEFSFDEGGVQRTTAQDGMEAVLYDDSSLALEVMNMPDSEAVSPSSAPIKSVRSMYTYYSGSRYWYYNGACIWAHHSYQDTNARATGSSTNVGDNAGCYWVNVSVWQGAALGQKCLHGYLGSGSTSRSGTSAAGYVSNPPPVSNKICSAHAAWGSDWAFNIPYLGFDLSV